MKRIFPIILLVCLALSACVPAAGTYQLEPRPALTPLPAITPVTDTVRLDPGFQEGLAYTTSADLSFEVTQPTGTLASGAITLQRTASGFDFLDTLTASGEAADDQAFLGQTQMVYRIASNTYYLATDDTYRLGQRERAALPAPDGKPALCMAFPVDNARLPLSLDNLFGGLKLPAEKTTETLDGQTVARYDLNQTAFPNAHFNSVTARAWVDENNRIVKLEGEAEGLFSLFGESLRQGHVKWTYMFKTAEPQTIAPPAVNCNTPVADIPLPDDAEIRASFQGLIDMKTGLSPEAAAAFYRQVLAAPAWSIYRDQPADAVTTIIFFNSEQRRAIQVIIGADPAGGTGILLTESDIRQ